MTGEPPRTGAVLAGNGSAGADAAARRGRLIVLAGPSGVGKSSVVEQLRRTLPELYFSVSATTRDARPGEVDGTDYHFVGPAGFDRLIERGELLEWAEIHGGLQRSGTPREPVEQQLAAGRPVLVEVDLNGARAIKRALPESVTVFLAPPSFEELARRLRRAAPSRRPSSPAGWRPPARRWPRAGSSTSCWSTPTCRRSPRGW